MASHLNAYNLAGSRVDVEGPVSGWRKKCVWAVIGIVAFLALDRSSLFLIGRQYYGLPDGRRYQNLYYSLKFQRFNRVKDHIETIVVGDSRARHGVDPMLFAGQSQESRVTAFNFAAASSGIEFTDILVREYLCKVPNLRTIVWEVSPRIFNRYWYDPMYELFVQSGGYHSDRLAAEMGFSRVGIRAGVELAAERIFSEASATYAHRSILKSLMLDGLVGDSSGRHFHKEAPVNISRWGFMEFPDSQCVDVSDPCEVGAILKSLESGRFEPDSGRMGKFCELVGFLGKADIRLICFVPPIHHSLMGSGVSDTDGTPNADYKQLMDKLRALESRFGNYRFVDLNKGGDNGFTDAEYGDFDHLNYAGSRRLSRKVGELISSAWSNTGEKSGDFAGSGTEVSAGNSVQVSAAVSGSQDTKPAVSGVDVTGPVIRSHLGKLDYRVGAFPPDNRPLIWAKYYDEGSGIDTKSVHVFMDGKDITANCRVRANKVSFKPARTLKSPKLYEFKVIVRDKAGNKSELVWEILLKPC